MSHPWTIVAHLIIAAGGTLPSLTKADHLPLWEAGIGLGTIHAPYYRGAKGTKDYALPVPYLIYRGDRLKADRNGFRGKLFESENTTLQMSIAGNIPVPSGAGGAREGMPGLDPVLEFGPSLHYKIWHNQENNALLWFKMPLRAAVSIGNPLMEYQGLVFSPYLQIEKSIQVDTTRWHFRLSVGPTLADAKYHNYFYEVDSKYITDSREEYHSAGGYSGSRATVTASRSAKHFYIGGFARYDTLSAAVFKNSPLVETRNYFVFGVFMAWVFANSSIYPPHE